MIIAGRKDVCMSKMCQLCGSAIEAEAEACPQCGAKILDQGDTDSRTAPVGKGLTRRILQVAIPIVVLIGMYSYYSDAFREYHPVVAKQPEVSAPDQTGKVSSTIVQARIEGPFMIVSLKEVQENGVVRFFDPELVQEIPVIAYLTSSGRLVTAMSISEGCRSRDFYIEGENIHCANCPSYWNASSLEAYACCQKYYPDPIPSTLLGDEVRIELETVRSWQARS